MFRHVSLKLVTVSFVRLLKQPFIVAGSVVQIRVLLQRLGETHFVLLAQVAKRLLDQADPSVEVAQVAAVRDHVSKRLGALLREKIERDVIGLIAKINQRAPDGRDQHAAGRDLVTP
uniref:(northern house mosquito) hypothetical protein n=1 Tax=Culex pipiens TaxID=7175 RepID=A0A8D8HHW8_CULPI